MRPRRTVGFSVLVLVVERRVQLPVVPFGLRGEHGLAANTSLLGAGVHLKVVSEALGHSSTAFTMDTYQHVLPTMGEQVAAAIEAALE